MCRFSRNTLKKLRRPLLVRINPSMIAFLGGGWSFLVFFICMCGQLLWVLKVMPKTKGIPLEEMSEKLGVE